jgi:hypothetical protein
LGIFLFSGLLSSSILAKEKFTADEKASFKENIDQIAHKLISNSIKKDTGIGWATLTKDGKTEESQDFYTGNPGICYFLLKAYAAVRYPEYLNRGKACMAYLQSQLRRDDKGLYLNQNYNGLFEGNAGPGYLFLYAYSLTKVKAYLKLAEDISTHIIQVPDIQKGSSPDIISGAAGTGLFLLKMYQVTKNKTYLQGAEVVDGRNSIPEIEGRAGKTIGRANKEVGSGCSIAVSHAPGAHPSPWKGSFRRRGAGKTEVTKLNTETRSATKDTEVCQGLNH